jgi:uncharacterized protein YxjI
VDLAKLQDQQRLLVQQKLTMMVNKYVISSLLPDGTPGEVVAFAQQKRMAFKEQVTIYTDEAKREVLCAFKARSVVDIRATYDVTAADGSALGWFRKNFAASLLRSTWHLQQQGGPEAVGRERSLAVALLRRAWDLLPYVDYLPFAVPYHFDFATAGQPVMSVTKKFGIRDSYVVDIPAHSLDRRLAIAQAVALDALQSR